MSLNNLQTSKNTFKILMAYKTKAIKKYNKKIVFFVVVFLCKIQKKGVRKSVSEANDNKSTQTIKTKKLNCYCL